MNDNANGTRNDINYIDVSCADVENNTTDRIGIEIGSSDVVKLLATSTLTIAAISYRFVSVRGLKMLQIRIFFPFFTSGVTTSKQILSPTRYVVSALAVLWSTRLNHLHDPLNCMCE